MKMLILPPILFTLLCGCANTSELTLSRSDTKIVAIFWNSETAQVIQIGSVDNPYRGDPKIIIKADDEIIFDSHLCSPDAVSNYIAGNDHYNIGSGIWEHPDARSLRSDKTWGKGAQCVDILKPASRKTNLTYDEARRQGVKVVAQDSKIRAIRIADFRCDPKEHMIKIKVDDSSWMNSRLTREQCIELFRGSVNEMRYFTE